MTPTTLWHVTCFYRFTPIAEAQLQEIRAQVLSWMADRNLKGLVLLAPEGVNGTIAGTSDAISEFKPFIRELVGNDDVGFKDSETDVRPFRRLTVDIREEIVGLKRPDLVPTEVHDHHLTPHEWHEWLQSDREKLLIDTRNTYETMAGKFKGAIDPGLKTFSDWTTYLDSVEIPKETPVLMYCTGGIRCEKAILEMRSRGFEKVYQLRDGILGYLAEFPGEEFEGECFVFDDRVTVGQDLKPTGNFGICPGCGLTASRKIECQWCHSLFWECDECRGKRPEVCSKTCLDRWTNLGPGRDMRRRH